VALSHVIKRPVILYASQHDIDTFGTGTYGIAGEFFPYRYHPSELSGQPVVVAWQSASHNHYIPLVWSAATNGADMVKWPQPKQSIPGEIPDPFGLDSVPEAEREAWHSFEVDYSKMEIKPPAFVQSLIQQIRESHRELEHMLRDGASIEEALAKGKSLIPHQFIQGDVAFTGHQGSAKGKALWGVAKKKLKSAMVNGVAYDHAVEHEGRTLGVNYDENVYGAALRQTATSDVASLTGSGIAMHQRTSSMRSSSSGINIAGLAVAIIRMTHEYALLESNPVEGVEVLSIPGEPFIWQIRVSDKELSEAREVQLTFPGTYPNEPPTAILIATNDQSQRPVHIPVCKASEWNSLLDARNVICSLKVQLISDQHSSGDVAQVAKEYFSLLDSDGDGFVSLTEGKEAMMVVYGMNEADARKMWTKILTKTDQDGDAEISYDEWLVFTVQVASMGKVENLKKQIARIQDTKKQGGGDGGSV